MSRQLLLIALLASLSRVVVPFFNLISPRTSCSRLFATGFYGIIKEIPCDFIVIEDGSLLNLDSVPLQSEPRAEAASVKSKSTELLDVDKAEIVSWIGTILQPQQLDTIAEIAAGNGSNLSAATVLTIKPPLDKATRTLFHQRLRILYPVIESKTEMGPDTTITSILVHQKGQRRVQDSRDSQTRSVLQRWDATKPEYHHFTAQKSMLSTTELIKEVSKALGLLPSRLQYAGSKDKRATTMQRLSVWRAERAFPTRIRAKNLDLLIYDVVPAAHKLSVGDLSGNYFCVTVRQPKENQLLNQQTSNKKEFESAKEAVKRLQVSAGKPFVNYFGPQRFGAPLRINPLVGGYLIRARYDLAVLMLLLSPSSEEEIAAGLTLERLREWLEGPRGAVSIEALIQSWREHVERVRVLLVERRPSREAGAVLPTGKEKTQLGGDGDTVLEMDETEIEAEVDELQDIIDGEDVPTVESDAAESDQVVSSEPDTDSIDRHSLMQRLLFIADLLEGVATDPRQIPRKTPHELKQLIRNVMEEMRYSQARVPKPSARFMQVDFSKVFSLAYTKQLKLLFVNALQSEKWNEAARKRHEREGEGDRGGFGFALERDVVLVDSNNKGVSQWEASGLDLTASSLLWDWQEEEEGGSGGREGREKRSPKQQQSFPVRLHRVTRQEASQRDFSANHVVLALPGSMTPESPLEYTDRTSPMFRVPGAYRHLLSSARNVGCVATDASCLEVPMPFSSLEKDSASDDASSCAFPSRVSELYASGRMQSLLQELLQSARSEFERPSDNGNSPLMEPRHQRDLRISFSLPASSYATTYLEGLNLVDDRSVI